jgi:hypothetical protein
MNCLSCGSVTPTRFGKHIKYCNKVCHDDYYLKISRKQYKEINCEVCFKKFKPVSSVHKVCSRKCKGKLEAKRRSKKPNYKICKFCGTYFNPYTSLDKFCSANCRVNNLKSTRSKNWNKESVERRKGKNNPYYKDGNSVLGTKKDGTGMRLFLKNRDEYRRLLIENHGYLFCEVCGKTNTRFEAHHIIFRSEKPRHEYLHDKKNIINLCVPCHNWFHSKKGNRNELVKKRELHLLFGNDVLEK